MPQPSNPDAPDASALTVFIVDDDEAMRRGLAFLVSSAGYEARPLQSAQAFLDQYQPNLRGCLLLDVRMPGMSGLELLDQMRSRGITMPVIFVTAFGNVPTAVRAIKAGAYDFIEKPFEGAELLVRVRNALTQVSRSPVRPQSPGDVQARLNSLTPREWEVMDRVVAGMLNKQIAADLDISIKTVENHRAKVMEKMQAGGLAELVRMTVSMAPMSRPTSGKRHDAP